MGISEVCSPVTRKGSKVASGQPLTPGARSNPSRGPQMDSVPPQPAHGRVSKDQQQEPQEPDLAQRRVSGDQQQEPEPARTPAPRNDSVRNDIVVSGRSVFFSPGNNFANFPSSAPGAQSVRSGEKRSLWGRLKIFGCV
jgi:hypothetical protein